MLSSVIDYSALSAKAKAMQKNLLKMDDYNALATQKNVSDVAKYLRDNTNYKDSISFLTESEFNRHSIERILLKSVIIDSKKQLNFIRSEKDKEFLEYYLLKNEIKLLKSALEIIFDEREVGDGMPEMSMFLNDKWSFDLSRLMESTNVSDFLDVLKDTNYYAVLHKAVAAGSPLFELETRLDIYYYLTLWNQIDKQFKNMTGMYKRFGSEIDLINFNTLYRLKKYYQIDPVFLYSKMIPVQYRLSKTLLSNLIDSKSFQEFSDIAKKSSFSNIFTAIEQKGCEETFHDAMFDISLKTLKAYPHSIMITLNYLFYKEVEIKNITMLIEGVRYSLNHEKIIDLLYVTNNHMFGGDDI